MFVCFFLNFDFGTIFVNLDDVPLEKIRQLYISFMQIVTAQFGDIGKKNIKRERGKIDF